MIQTILTFDENDGNQICAALEKLSISFFHDGSNKTVTVRKLGFLELEVDIHRLREELPGIELDVADPEVLFTQTMVRVKVEGPTSLYQYVVKEFRKRLPDREEIEVLIKSERMTATGRFPVFTVQNLMQCFAGADFKHELQTTMYDFADECITESELRAMLNTFVSG